MISLTTEEIRTIKNYAASGNGCEKVSCKNCVFESGGVCRISQIFKLNSIDNKSSAISYSYLNSAMYSELLQKIRSDKAKKLKEILK